MINLLNLKLNYWHTFHGRLITRRVPFFEKHEILFNHIISLL